MHLRTMKVLGLTELLEFQLEEWKEEYFVGEEEEETKQEGFLNY